MNVAGLAKHLDIYPKAALYVSIKVCINHYKSPYVNKLFLGV